jgi:predicted nucleic-acid-binding protein
VRAVDTNLLVRLIARDNPKQVSAAELFVSKGAWVSQLVLAETVWMLESVYEFGARPIADAIEMLLNHAQLVVQDADAAGAALAQFRRRPAVGFSDCLTVEVARRHGHLPVGTFDRDLGRIDGVERLKSA